MFQTTASMVIPVMTASVATVVLIISTVVPIAMHAEGVGALILRRNVRTMHLIPSVQILLGTITKQVALPYWGGPHPFVY